tara:strand:+ start:432 stop:1316 length:885 start_codon:yes stop_codon:yes gene_type:complete
MMKIIFLGSTIFSNKILIEINKKFNVVGVCTIKKSDFYSDYFNLAKTAKSLCIPCYLSKNINSKATEKWIKKYDPDLIICCGWSSILKKNILNLPKYGCIGYHPSDLPMNKGRHPIIWSIFLGLKYCFSTFFVMTNKIDNGTILSKEKTKIKKYDNATSIYKKLNSIASKQIIKILKNLNKNKNIIKKKYIAKSNYWRKRTEIDGLVDWRMSAHKINLLVRSLNYPYPNAHFNYKGKSVKIKKAKEISDIKFKNIEPGKIISNTKGKIMVKCGEGLILLEKFKPKINIKENTYL